jgi:glucose-1-phosphate thymidylyltransferase
MMNSLMGAAAKSFEREVVGLMPAGGKAERISPLPCSKELFPLGFQLMEGSSQPRPKAVGHYLLEKFQLAGIAKTYIILRKGKWDIPDYFGHGAFVNMHLGYLIMGESLGPPFTLDQAYPFVHDKLVAFGFPDIMISSENVFSPLLKQQERTQADVVLAVFPAHNPQLMDMVEMDENGKIHAMFLKPGETDLELCWLGGVWTPVFTQFMHEYLQDFRGKNDFKTSKCGKLEVEDLTVGAVIQAAINKGVQVYGVVFPDGKYIDIGTADNLMKSVEMFGCQMT